MTGPEFSDILDQVKGIAYGDEPDLDTYDDLDGLWSARNAVQSVISAAKKLQSAIDGSLAEQLGARSARMDDFFLRVKPRRTLVIVDPDSFWKYLGPDARLCFRPDQVRVTSLRAVAQARGEDPRVIFDSLCDYDYGDPGLEVVPLDKAPKYAAQMEPGELREKGRRR